MTRNELLPGQSRTGYAWDRKIPDPYPAMLRDNQGRIELVVPYDPSVSEHERRRYVGDSVTWGDDPDMTLYDYALPDQLWFYDAHGFVCLVGVRRADGFFIGGETNLTQAILRIAFAVFTGDPRADYSRVNGLSAQIEGLDQWYGVRSVINSLDGSMPITSDGITLAIKDPTTTRIDAALNLSLRAGAKWQLSGGIGKTSIEDWGATRTLVVRPRAWNAHLERHRAIHRLLELAAWRPLGFDHITAMHARDPQRVLSGDAVGDRWAPIATYELPAPEDQYRHLRFLFRYSDIGAVGVRRWLRISGGLKRGINAMTFSIRHRDTSLEGLISDAGIGLEEIGYGLQQEHGDTVSRLHHKKLEAVAAMVDDLLPFDGIAWASESTEVYNNVKHADRPEADLDAMVVSLKQNRIVFRTWIARRLGVKDEVIRRGSWLLDRS